MPDIIISRANNRTKSPYVNAIIYGPSGIGKTVLGATAPTPLIISAEDGLLSISDQEIDTTDVRSLEEFEAAYEFLANSEHSFETAIVDSLSEIAQVLLAEYAAVERDKRQAYGKMADEILSLVRKFRKLPMHVVFNAKQARIVDEFTGKTTFGAKFPGKVLVSELPYQLDEVIAMKFQKHEGKEFRVLQCHPDIQFDAKDRSGNLSKLEKPDLSVLFEKILTKKPVDE